MVGKLKALRDIRNFAAHNANITDTKMNKYFHTITSFLKTPALIQYTSAKESLDIVDILSKHSIRDIIENKLLSEEIRTRLENKIYGGTSRSKYYFISSMVSTISVFITMVAILLATAHGKVNYNCLFDKQTCFSILYYLFDIAKRCDLCCSLIINSKIQ